MSLEKRITELEERAGPTGTLTRERVVAELGREPTVFEERVLTGWLTGRYAVAEYVDSPEEFRPLIGAWKACGGEPVKVIFLPFNERDER